MMVKWPAAISSSGALTIWTRLAFFAGGGTWAATGFEKITAAITAVITSFRIGLVMGSSSVSASSSTSCNYGIAGLGRGGMAQTLLEHGGSVGVGIRVSLPCVDAEPPVLHRPVKVLT